MRRSRCSIISMTVMTYCGACCHLACSSARCQVKETDMRKFILLFLLLPLTCLARDWQVDMAKSTLTFTGAYQSGPFTGKFGKFDATISYDEADLSKSRFDVKVDLTSVDTQSSERDDTLRTADFFNTAKFPQAHFVTSSFERGADGV